MERGAEGDLIGMGRGVLAGAGSLRGDSDAPAGCNGFGNAIDSLSPRLRVVGLEKT
jgi:hypothetical protein